MSNLLEVNSLNVQFNYDETTVQAVKMSLSNYEKTYPRYCW